MENLPDWAVAIIAVAVGLSPGLAILCAPAIAQLIYHLLGLGPEVMPEPEGGPARDEPAGAAASRV